MNTNTLTGKPKAALATIIVGRRFPSYYASRQDPVLIKCIETNNPDGFYARLKTLFHAWDEDFDTEDDTDVNFYNCWLVHLVKGTKYKIAHNALRDEILITESSLTEIA